MRFLILFSSALLLLHTFADCREYHYDKPQTPFISGAIEESFRAPQPGTPNYHAKPAAPATVVRTQNGQAYEVSMAGSQQIYQGRLTAITTSAQQVAYSGRAYPPPAVVSYSGAAHAQHGHQTPAYQSGQNDAAFTGQSVAQYSSNANPLIAAQYAPHSVYSSAPQQLPYYPAAAQGNSQQSSSLQSGIYSGQPSQPAAVYQGTPQLGAPNYLQDTHSSATYSKSSQSGAGQQETAPAKTTYYILTSPAGSSQAGGYQPTTGGPQGPAGGHQGPAGGHQGPTGPFQTAANHYSGTSQSGSIQSGKTHAVARYPGGTYYNGNSQAGAAHAGSNYATSTGYPGPNGAAFYSGVGASRAGSNAAQYQSAAYNQGHSQSGGGTNYGTNGQFTAADPLNGQIGGYVSQSESSQLDGYAYKQQGNGDARSFKRIITTCYPGGKCERQELAAGQADGRHQHFVMAARARIAPVSDKCRRIAAAAAGVGATNAYGVATPASNIQTVAPPNRASNRPLNRRLYEYSEVVQRDPFN